MIADHAMSYRVLDASGELITGGVTRESASVLDVFEAIQRLELAPDKQRERTPDGWIVERE